MFFGGLEMLAVFLLVVFRYHLFLHLYTKNVFVAGMPEVLRVVFSVLLAAGLALVLLEAAVE